jgi:hypothetical protein
MQKIHFCKMILFKEKGPNEKPLFSGNGQLFTVNWRPIVLKNEANTILATLCLKGIKFMA